MSGQSRKPVIGIVGGIGAGKTLVARQFGSLGCGVINADELVTQAYADPQVVAQVRNWWGDDAIKPDGTVNRQTIAKIVFNSADELAQLEDLLHPRVHEGRRRLREQYHNDPDVVAIVEDTPLLIEKGLDGECDVLVFVVANKEVRRRRVAESRGWSAEELAAREKKQAGLDIKAARADYVVENNGDEAQCLAHVRRVLSRILHDANSPRDL